MCTGSDCLGSNGRSPSPRWAAPKAWQSLLELFNELRSCRSIGITCATFTRLGVYTLCKCLLLGRRARGATGAAQLRAHTQPRVLQCRVGAACWPLLLLGACLLLSGSPLLGPRQLHTHAMCCHHLLSSLLCHQASGAGLLVGGGRVEGHPKRCDTAHQPGSFRAICAVVLVLWLCSSRLPGSPCSARVRCAAHQLAGRLFQVPWSGEHQGGCIAQSPVKQCAVQCSASNPWYPHGRLLAAPPLSVVCKAAPVCMVATSAQLQCRLS